MANQIFSVPAGTGDICDYAGMRIYAIMLPPSDFSIAHCGSDAWPPPPPKKKYN